MTSGDPTPSGKRKVVSLREKIREIENNIKRGMYTTDMTVCELVEKYLTTKTGVAYSTRQGYQFVQNLLEKESFGQRKIMEVKTSDAKIFLIQLQESGKGYSTVCTVRGVLRPAFQMAADDDMIIKNPFQFELHTVVVNDSVKRDAITREQERKFLEFIENDPHYSQFYDAIFILFKTGRCISEFCELTIKEVDFRKNVLRVNHQLQRTRGMQYVIEDTKTSSGTRMLPMTDEVYECFEQIVKNRKKVRVEPIIDEYSRFLFLDKKDMPEVALHWEKHFQWALGKYNRTHEEQMPKITPHGRVIIRTS